MQELTHKQLVKALKKELKTRERLTQKALDRIQANACLGVHITFSGGTRAQQKKAIKRIEAAMNGEVW